MDKLILKEVKAVIFDVDNTLLQTDKFVLSVIQLVISNLRAEGVVFADEIKVEHIQALQAQSLLFEEMFKQLFIGFHERQELWKICWDKYFSLSSSLRYEATPGSVSAVKQLFEAGFVLGLVTNRKNNLEKRLIEVGFDLNWFSFICSPTACEFTKPHPQAFAVAIKELDRLGIKPEQTVMVGDHLFDFLPSVYHNMDFIAVLHGQTKRQDFLEKNIDNNLIVDNLDNILAVIEKSVIIKSYRRSLQNSTAVDGRYGATTNCLKHYFSEYAFHKYRVRAEVEHLIALSEFFQGIVIRPLSGQEKLFLRQLADNFDYHDAYEVLQYDHLGRKGIGPVEHDCKAIELWIKEKLASTTLSDIVSHVHIFLTSEDVRNIAHKLMFRLAMNEVIYPMLFKIGDRLQQLSEQYISDPVMGRTHFQPASPTTFGKIFATYLARLTNALERLNEIKLQIKVNGAVGNYNCFIAAYPDLDWIGYSKYLAKQLNFSTFLWTDQRGPHHDVIRLFQSLQEAGNVLRDLATDLSFYTGLGLMYLAKVESHVGSSVMPHKVNPWLAEVAEGNLSRANYLINGLSNHLDVSRLQRDLSDHAWERSYGDIFGAFYLSFDYIFITLNMLGVDTKVAQEELDRHPQIVTEALQTVLRKHGVVDAYDILKKNFRGGKVSVQDLDSFINQLSVEENIKQELWLLIDSKKYLGLAKQLSRLAINYYEDFKKLSL